MESLADQLRAKRRDTDTGNADWRRFIEDHRTTLLSTAIDHVIEAETMLRYRYRLEMFVTDELSLPSGHAWIIGWLNGITGITGFTDVTSLKVPDVNTITDLYSLFKTNTAARNKAAI